MSVLVDMRSSEINLLDSDDDGTCAKGVDLTRSRAPSSTAPALAGGAASATGVLVDLSMDTPIIIDFSGCIDLTGEGTESYNLLSAGLQSAFDNATFQSTAEDCLVVGEKKQEDVCWKQRRDVHEFLKRAAGQLQVEQVEPNPHARPGEPLYERFRAALAKVEDKTIKLVFHGTPEKNVAAILQDGLDPGRRRGQVYGAGEYFGTDAGTSLSYVQGGRSMIIFAVLLDATGITHHQENGAVVGGAGAPSSAVTSDMAESSGPGMVVVHKHDHQLPLFSLRFTVKHQFARHQAALVPPPRPTRSYSLQARGAVKKATKRAPKPRKHGRVNKPVPASPGVPAATATSTAPKTSWTEEETQKIVEATRKAVLEKRKKKKAEAAAVAAS